MRAVSKKPRPVRHVVTKSAAIREGDPFRQAIEIFWQGVFGEMYDAFELRATRTSCLVAHGARGGRSRRERPSRVRHRAWDQQGRQERRFQRAASGG